MKAKYDTGLDVLSILLSDSPVAESGEDKPGLIPDYGRSGNVVALARISHRVSSRDAGEGRGYEARAARRAEAYLNSTSSTPSKRNEVDVALSRVAAESW